MTKPYIRPQADEGQLVGWEQSLANLAMSEIAKAGTRLAVVSLHPHTGKPCLLFSTGGMSSVFVVALYDVFSNVSLKTIARQRYDTLLDDWENHCGAFVVFEYSVKAQPSFMRFNSGATSQSADELAKKWCSEFPPLDLIDRATGSSLAYRVQNGSSHLSSAS